MPKYNFIDTDLFIHRLDYDPAINKAAQNIFDNNHPSSMSSFSLLELKGNYISDLVLLHRKIQESESFTEGCAKIRKTGGRKSELMFAMLIKWIGQFSPHPWNERRREILAYLDGQISVAWESFQINVDTIFDDFKCSRAAEAPEDDGEKWKTTIPNCRQDNTECTIVNFMNKYIHELKNLIVHLNNLDPPLLTPELQKIRKIAMTTVNDNYPWEGKTCRQVADLIIGLQSKAGYKLISSNYKEHSQLHSPLGYTFEHFDVVKIRTQ
jgi:hypothetical protein